MLNLQTTASSKNADAANQSATQKKKEGGSGDFLGALLASLNKGKSNSTSGTNSTNSASGSSSNTMAQNSNEFNPQNSVQNISENSFKSEFESSSGAVSTGADTSETSVAEDTALVIEEGKSEALGSISEGQELSQKGEMLSDNAPVSSEGEAINDEGFMQVLSVLEGIFGGEAPQIAKISSTLEKLISIEENLAQLKDVKDLKDLIKIAEKLKLGLEKLTITSEALSTLKSKLPALDKADFFKSVDVSLNKAALSAKNAKPAQQVSLASLLGGKTAPKSITQVLKEAELEAPKLPKTAPKESGLKGLLNNDDIKSKAPKSAKEIVEKVSSKDTKELLNQKTGEPQSTQKAVQKGSASELKDLLKMVTTNTKEPKTAASIADEAKKALKAEPKTAASIADEAKKALKTEPKIATNPLPSAPKVAKSEVDELKAFDIQNYLNSISKKAASALETTPASTSGANTLADMPNQPSDEARSSFGDAIENRLSDNNFKDMITALKMQDKIISRDVQQNSVRTFAAEMVEKISEFKPPVTRVNLQLHPAELGEVNITMIARANNLHVNVTSANATMALFLQNQAEFKANLVNMGFSDIQMSFSDHKEGSNTGQNGQKAKKSYESDEDGVMINEFEGSSESTLEIVLPRYI